MREIITKPTLQKYYNALIALKSAEKNMHTIYLLYQSLQNYERNSAIQLLSNILVKYQREFDIIGDLYSGLNVKHTKSENAIELNIQKSDKEIIEEMSYAINCLVIIYSVEQQFASSIQEVIEKIAEE